MTTSRLLWVAIAAAAIAGCGGSDDADGGPDAGSGDTGTLAGAVTRTAAVDEDGRGDLYIGIFESDPVADPDAATPVGNQRIEDADLSADDAMIPYEIGGIPPRSEPYFVTAFLDDNGTVTDPAAAAPDRGDLVAIDGIASPQVTISSATRVEADLDLNFNLPF